VQLCGTNLLKRGGSENPNDFDEGRPSFSATFKGSSFWFGKQLIIEPHSITLQVIQSCQLLCQRGVQPANQFLTQTREISTQKVIEAMSKRVAIYSRVSTDGQTVDNQLLDLSAVAEHQGWSVVKVFSDEGISGANGREKRPAYDELCKGAIRQEFDVIMSWSVDRLGRSLQHLVTFLGEIHSKGVDLYLHQQGIDTTTPAGKAMFQMCGVFAEFERAMIQERVKAGLARAKAQGKTLGRPRVKKNVEKAVLAARAEGTGKRKISKQLGIGVSTVNRVLAEAKRN